MQEWHQIIQRIVDEIDLCIRNKSDEIITLQTLSQKLGYSEFYLSRKFREISGLQFRDYLRYRKLAFALKEVRDTDQGILKIALDYGFSSHEAFTRAFKEAYGIAPSEYRRNPVPVVLRTITDLSTAILWNRGPAGRCGRGVKVYFVTIPDA